MQAMVYRPAIPKIKDQPLQVERQEKKDKIRTREEREKTKVRKRDSYRCRWPRCEFKLRAEVAHGKAKGMGGDHGERSTANQMICLCHQHHRGPVSIHTGDLKFEPTTPKGTYGPCRFLQKIDNRWHVIGEERYIHVLV